MKTYEPRRNNACPNGLHPDYDPEKDPSQNECTCPWLIIQSSTPVQHLTSWNRRELDNAIREFDNGYFDPPGYPRRERSMFLSAPMQRLLDVAEKSPVAAALTLLAGSGTGLPPFDAIAWDAEDAVLSVRVPGLGWRRLWLGHANVEAVTDSDFTTAGGANPVLLWADHPDTWEEIDLPHEPIASPREGSEDVYAEGEENLAECQRNGTCCGTCNADFGTCCTHDPSPIKTTPAQVIAMAQDAADVAANSTTARIMGDYMPLFLTVPADEIENLRAGNPVFDEAMRQAQEGGHAGFVAMPEEMTATEIRLHTNPELVEQIQRTIDDPSSRVRGERPLPRRVPKVPSDIAEAGHGDDYCTCDLNLRYQCPACRSATDDPAAV